MEMMKQKHVSFSFLSNTTFFLTLDKHNQLFLKVEGKKEKKQWFEYV